MSSVEYVRLPASLSIDRERVSRQQYVLLTELEDKLPAGFNVNEGHRTWERQQQLVNSQGLYSASNPHGAAAPSAAAPHILTGHSNHALDCALPADLARAARGEGLVYRYTVPTESWHIQIVDEAKLNAWLRKERTRRQKAKRAAALRVRRAKRRVLVLQRRLKKADHRVKVTK